MKRDPSPVNTQGRADYCTDAEGDRRGFQINQFPWEIEIQVNDPTPGILPLLERRSSMKMVFLDALAHRYVDPCDRPKGGYISFTVFVAYRRSRIL